jgi:nucleotide-binding universal stress UspA family protein
MMGNLLAIVKDPKDSKEFVKYALNLASDLQISLHLLYVQDPANYALGSSGITGNAQVQIELNLKKMAEEAKKILVDLVRDYASSELLVRISTETGIIRTIIEGLIENEKINMVLLESRETDGFWTQNSTDMEIIRNVKCPVWIIPKKSGYKPFREIIYATDYKEEDLVTLKKLIGLTQGFSPGITALHITDDYDFDTRIRKEGFHEIVQRKTSYDKISLKSLVNNEGKDLGPLINDYASLINADLIVVLKENHHFIERLFRSSATKAIVQQANIPVLVYHARGT